MHDLHSVSLAELARRLRARELRARDLAERCLARDRHGAYREVEPAVTLRQADEADEAFDAARELGPLQGVPTSVKDLYGVAGFSTWAGTARGLPKRFERQGPVIDSVRGQLAVVTGKTHTVELAFGGLGTNAHHPTPRNPWATDAPRAPGGSSSGAGVSLCEGSALLALGTDTAGSVRIPAAWTGNVALKTTAGRWPTRGIVPLSSTLDTAGVLARDVADLTAAFEAIDGRVRGGRAVPGHPDPKSLRLGRCDALFLDDCSPGVVEAFERGLAELESAGVAISAVALPEAREAYEIFLQGGPVSAELAAFLRRELPDRLGELDANVAARIEGALSLAAVDYIDRLEAMEVLSSSVTHRLEDVDALLTPTVANSPPLLSEIEAPELYRRENLRALRNTAIVSYLGLCAVTIPVGLDAVGMPVGLQIIARPGVEPALLATAAALERVLGRSIDRLGAPPGL